MAVGYDILSQQQNVTTTKWHDHVIFIARDADFTQDLQTTGWDLVALNMLHLRCRKK